MAQLTVQSVSTSGKTITYSTAAAGGDAFANNGMTVFRVKNGGASPITVTINSVKKCSYGFDHDVVVTVNPSEEKAVGTFDRERFSDDTGNVQVTYSAVTSVTVCAISVI